MPSRPTWSTSPRTARQATESVTDSVACRAVRGDVDHVGREGIVGAGLCYTTIRQQEEDRDADEVALTSVVVDRHGGRADVGELVELAGAGNEVGLRVGLSSDFGFGPFDGCVGWDAGVRRDHEGHG